MTQLPDRPNILIVPIKLGSVIQNDGANKREP